MIKNRRRLARCRLQACQGTWKLGWSGPYARSLERQIRIASGIGIFILLGALLPGCSGWTLSEVRGKNAFGPEYRNRGNGTSEVRYDVRQAVDLRWNNGWTTGVSYRRRDVDEGSGDNENRVLLEVSYPIWKAPKKPDKTAQQIENLEEQIEEMRTRMAALKAPASNGGQSRVAQADGANPLPD